jgi:hypothetical protein
MNPHNAVRVAAVRCTRDHRLTIRWVGGARSEVDLADFVNRYKGLRPLRSPVHFADVAVGEGGHSVAWPGGLDIGADRLWEMALEQSGHHDAAEFLRWRWRHGLSLAAAAEGLGLSRRTVAYYASGTRAVPRTVLLACKGWEREREEARAAAA